MSRVYDPPRVAYLPAVERPLSRVNAGLQWPSERLSLRASVQRAIRPELPPVRLSPNPAVPRSPQSTGVQVSAPRQAPPIRQQPQYQPRDPDNPFSGGTKQQPKNGGTGGPIPHRQ